MLASQRLGARPYSLSALQKFATCPYQFAAVGDLPARAERGAGAAAAARSADARSHSSTRCRREFFRAMQRAGRLPVDTPAACRAALRCSIESVAEVAAEYDENARAGHRARVARRDRRASAATCASGSAAARGATAGRRRTSSSASACRTRGATRAASADPVTIDGRFMLRGSIDLSSCGRAAASCASPITRPAGTARRARTVIGGGAMLQPVLYGLAVEQLLATPVVSGRLFYCTAAGGFTDHEIPLTDANRTRRARGARDRRSRHRARLPAAGAGARAPAPGATSGAVCGPDEEKHAARKPPTRSAT